MKNNLFSLTLPFLAACRLFEAPNEHGTTPPATETPPVETPPSAITGTPSAEEPPAGEETTEPKPDEATTEEPAVELLTMESITLPEGFAVPEEAQEEFLGVLNDPEISRAELVNKLIEMQTTANGSAEEQLAKALQETFSATQTGWLAELKALPDFGGEAYDRNLAEIKQGMEFAGAGAEVFKALDVTGAGNHPALVPFLHKLVKPFLEADPVTTQPNTGKLGREQRMFPDMK